MVRVPTEVRCCLTCPDLSCSVLGLVCLAQSDLQYLKWRDSVRRKSSTSKGEAPFGRDGARTDDSCYDVFQPVSIDVPADHPGQLRFPGVPVRNWSKGVSG